MTPISRPKDEPPQKTNASSNLTPDSQVKSATKSATKPGAKFGAKSDRSRLRRMHARGGYDATTIYPILDANLMCTVAYVIDGLPYATPTLQWREGTHIYWHGSSASRMLRHSQGHEVCLTVAALDGYVMARSGMNHSANYRSAMLFGTACKIVDNAEKAARPKAFVDQLFPGRWDMLRPLTTQELKATTILGMEINEASSKVRQGHPADDEADYDLPIWAGTIPVKLVVGDPINDPRNLPGVEIPEHILKFVRDQNL